MSSTWHRPSVLTGLPKSVLVQINLNFCIYFPYVKTQKVFRFHTPHQKYLEYQKVRKNTMKQDHLRMNNSTGSSNHVRSIHHFTSFRTVDQKFVMLTPPPCPPPPQSVSQSVRNSQNIVRIQSECRQNVGRMQSKCSQIVARITE